MDSKGVARGSLARSLTPEVFFQGYLREREDEDVKDGERNVLYVRVSERERERRRSERFKEEEEEGGGMVVETGRHTNLFNYDPRLQL